MPYEGNAPKNGEPTTGFSFTTMLQHTGWSWSRIKVHSPYSPDLDPVDFYLFPPLKWALKGRRFCDATDIIKNAKEELQSLAQNGFQEFFQRFYIRCQKCTVAQPGYLEGKVA